MNDTYIYRLLSSGVIDTSFGTASSTVVPNLQHGIRLAPDGKIVLGGIDTTNLANNALIFTRLTADGAVDTSFGTNGRTDVLLVDAVASGQGFNLEVTADGKILYAYPYGARSDEIDSAVLERVPLVRSVSFTWTGVADPCPN